MTIKITKVSQLTGKTHTMNLDITREQIKKWENGMLIQYAMPNLNVHEREFLITGATASEWDALFNEE